MDCLETAAVATTRAQTVPAKASYVADRSFYQATMNQFGASLRRQLPFLVLCKFTNSHGSSTRTWRDLTGHAIQTIAKTRTGSTRTETQLFDKVTGSILVKATEVRNAQGDTVFTHRVEYDPETGHRTFEEKKWNDGRAETTKIAQAV